MMRAMSAQQSETLAAALWYAQQGWPVFPCGQHKRPLISRKDGGRGLHDATTDLDKIRLWWSAYPDALIGMPTGPASGLWVLDVDLHGEVRGDDSLSDLEQQHGRLPETMQSITQSGGWHFFFSMPADDRKVVSRSSKLAPGLDVRGHGGYVILPPSPGTQGRYEWEGSSDPADGVEPAAAPAWLLDLVCAPVQRAPVLAPVESRGGAPARAEVESALAVLSADAYDDWVQAGMALHGAGVSWGYEVWDAWSQGSDKYAGADKTLEKWASFGRYSGRQVGMGSVFSAAMAAGWRRPGPARSDGPIPPSPPLEAYADDASAGGGGRSGLRVVGGTEHDPRPSIELVNGELPDAVDAAERHLIDARADIFQHGTRLVRVGSWDVSLGSVREDDFNEAPVPLGRPHGSGVLIDISPEWLTDELTRHIRWRRYDARKSDWKRIDAPSKVASTLLARSGSWRFPPLVGFCDAPTLDLRGRVVSEPGYDARSGLYLSHPPVIRAIGEMGRLDAEGAGDILHEAVSTFPFVSDADRAACLALIMTALLRRVLPAAPIGCVSANTPGTGKSKLVDVIAAIATGRPAAVAALGTTPEELEKRVDSVLLKGDTVCSFDNVDRAVKSDVLCQVATQQVKSIRVMGLSKIVEAPTNVCLMMTGNNLTLVGDLVRRCLVVNLDAGCERPELRVFERDAIDYVLERRAELVRCALILSKAYLDVGCPDVKAQPYGSFETWDAMVRRPLIWAGWPDPLAPAEAMRDQDHELAATRDFLIAWRKATTDPVTAAELTEMVGDRVPAMGDGWSYQYPELHESAVQLLGDPGKWGARELGYRLRAINGRLFSGLRVRKQAKGDRAGTARWAVEDG